jgi:hemimethylated DNA binding protein
MSAGRVVLRELRAAAAQYDGVLERLVNADSARAFRGREVGRFARFVARERRVAALAGARSVDELFARAFPDGMEDRDVDSGLAALRKVNERRELIHNQGKGWNCTKPDRVMLDIGMMFRHRKWGFRGTIIQWFSSCPASEAWVAQHGPFQHGAAQPFYRTLVDTRDRSPPLMTLAAEENLIVLEDEATGILHPKLGELFQDFEFGHHVLTPTMADAYREDW